MTSYITHYVIINFHNIIIFQKHSNFLSRKLIYKAQKYLALLLNKFQVFIDKYFYTNNNIK